MKNKKIKQTYNEMLNGIVAGIQLVKVIKVNHKNHVRTKTY